MWVIGTGLRAARDPGRLVQAAFGCVWLRVVCVPATKKSEAGEVPETPEWSDRELIRREQRTISVLCFAIIVRSKPEGQVEGYDGADCSSLVDGFAGRGKGRKALGRHSIVDCAVVKCVLFLEVFESG